MQLRSTRFSIADPLFFGISKKIRPSCHRAVSRHSFVRIMENVLVFATTVETPLGVSGLAHFLDKVVGEERWNFDLDDCDRVLRIVGDCPPAEVIGVLESAGYRCTELGDEVPEAEWLEDERMAS